MPTPNSDRNDRLHRASRDTSNSSYSPISPFGGLIPEGGQVRIFSLGHNLRPALSAGRGRVVPVQWNSLVEQPTQPASRGHERSVSTQPPNRLANPLHMNEHGRGVPIQQAPLGVRPQERPNQSVGQLALSQRSVVNGLQLVKATTSELTAPRSASLLQENPGSSASVKTLTIDWVPPHLRKGSESQPSAPQSPASSQQVSPRLLVGSPEVFVVDVNENLCTVTTLKAREIFHRVEVGVWRQAAGDNKLMPGLLVIYELLDAPVGIWELAIKNYMVTRGDVRELLDILPNGSKVFLRRQAKSPPKSSVQSTPLKFESIAEAQNLIREVNVRREQYRHSSEPIHIETTKQLSPVEDATKHGLAIESADKAERKLDTPSLPTSKPEPPKSEKSVLEKPNPEELKLKEPVTELDKSMEEPESTIQPTTSPTVKVESPPAKTTVVKSLWAGSGWSDAESDTQPASPTAKVESPLAKATALENQWARSGWTSNDLIDLTDAADALDERRDELTGLSYEPSVAAECCTPRANTTIDTPTEQASQAVEETGGPSGLQFKEQPNSAEQTSDSDTHKKGEREHNGKTHTKVAEEVLNALRDPEAIKDICVGKDLSEECLRLLSNTTSADYAEMAVMAKHLTRVLEPYETPSSTPYSKTQLAAFQASLLHLKQKHEFIDLSLDDQKKTLAVIHANVLHGKSRIIRSSVEISALRLDGRDCPEPVKELNAQIRNWNRKHSKANSLSSQPPAYSPSIVTKNKSTNMEFLYSHSTIDAPTLPRKQAPLDVATFIPRSMSKEATPSESSKVSDKAPKGLRSSRWAEHGQEDAEKQPVTRGENLQPLNPSSS
ncbi:hypothetical protein HD806DRAFT_444030 [Xylariaceae sp. AK1471]|nr:hypothetical protein HD806DRAFT_444030 [Xylariaceae sp. AK1471]